MQSETFVAKITRANEFEHHAWNIQIRGEPYVHIIDSRNTMICLQDLLQRAWSAGFSDGERCAKGEDWNQSRFL